MRLSNLVACIFLLAPSFAAMAGSYSLAETEATLDRYLSTGDPEAMWDLVRRVSPDRLDAMLRKKPRMVRDLTDGDDGVFRSGDELPFCPQFEMAMDSQGRPHVAWAGPESGEGPDVRYAFWDGRAWSDVLRVPLKAPQVREEITFRSLHLRIGPDDTPYVVVLTRTKETEMWACVDIKSSDEPRWFGPGWLGHVEDAYVCLGKAGMHVFCAERPSRHAEDHSRPPARLYEFCNPFDPSQRIWPSALPRAGRYDMSAPQAVWSQGRFHVIAAARSRDGKTTSFVYLHGDSGGWTIPRTLCAPYSGRRWSLTGPDGPEFLVEPMAGETPTRKLLRFRQAEPAGSWDLPLSVWVCAAASGPGGPYLLLLHESDSILLARPKGDALEAVCLRSSLPPAWRGREALQLLVSKGYFWAAWVEVPTSRDLQAGTVNMYHGPIPSEGWQDVPILAAQLSCGRGLSERTQVQAARHALESARRLESQDRFAEALDLYFDIAALSSVDSVPKQAVERLRWLDKAGVTEVRRRRASRIIAGDAAATHSFLPGEKELLRYPHVLRQTAALPEQDAPTIRDLVDARVSGSFVVWLADGKEAVVVPDTTKVTALFAPDTCLDQINDGILDRHGGLLRARVREALDGVSPDKLAETPISLFGAQFSHGIVDFAFNGFIHYGTVRLGDLARWTVRPRQSTRLAYLLDWYKADKWVSGRPREELLRMAEESVPAAIARLGATPVYPLDHPYSDLVEVFARTPTTRDRTVARLKAWLESAHPNERGWAYSILRSVLNSRELTTLAAGQLCREEDTDILSVVLTSLEGWSLSVLEPELAEQVTRRLIDLSLASDRGLSGLAIHCLCKIPTAAATAGLVKAVRANVRGISLEAHSLVDRLRSAPPRGLSETDLAELTPSLLKALSTWCPDKPDLVASFRHADVLPTLFRNLAEHWDDRCIAGRTSAAIWDVFLRSEGLKGCVPSVIPDRSAAAIANKTTIDAWLDWYERHKARLSWDQSTGGYLLTPE